MASAMNDENPNSNDIVQPEQQVMSSPNVVTAESASGVSSIRGPGGVSTTPGTLDMDGETVAAEQQPVRLGQQGMALDATATDQALVNGTGVRASVQQQDSRISGPGIDDLTASGSSRAGQPPLLSQPGLLGGLQRVVQAVESVVQGGPRMTVSPNHHDAVEYASVKSSISAEVNPPSASTLPETPLFTEASMLRMRQMEANDPLLYARREFATTGPSSTSSGDIQAEVRRQLAELMSERDEEGRRLRAQVAALAYENIGVACMTMYRVDRGFLRRVRYPRPYQGLGG